MTKTAIFKTNTLLQKQIMTLANSLNECVCDTKSITGGRGSGLETDGGWGNGVKQDHYYSSFFCVCFVWFSLMKFSDSFLSIVILEFHNSSLQYKRTNESIISSLYIQKETHEFIFFSCIYVLISFLSLSRHGENKAIHSYHGGDKNKQDTLNQLPI